MKSFSFAFLSLLVMGTAFAVEPAKLQEGSRLVLIGNGLGSRMGLFPSFEAEVQMRFAGQRITIRDLCDEGDTPGFRPHSGRDSPWAFPGAEKYRPLSEAKDRWGSGNTGSGTFEAPDQWLTRLKSDVVVAFFGFNESFDGAPGLEGFRGELGDFVKHTQARQYNGKSAPQLVLVSPIAFENLSATHGTPDGKTENANLALYAKAMEEVAAQHGVRFVDLLGITRDWYEKERQPLTLDGALLSEEGYARLAPVLADAIFGPAKARKGDPAKVAAAVQEKNWVWLRYYKVPNGVHVFGRRHAPYGPKNYPDELAKLEEMTAVRDEAIWAALAGMPFDLAAADAKTKQLPPIITPPDVVYQGGEEAIASIKVAPGYSVGLFASEKEFPNLANPVQLSFDNKGRLWVATMPSYPHWRPGDPKPDDKLLILEDTNGDGKADKELVFADKLHLPTGFELAPEGVYVAQGNNLLLLRDTNGDDRADVRTTILSGFDDHDTHHVISAFCADPSGAIYMEEGTFLHTHVETAYGPVRSSNGGFFRYSPQRHQLERSARLSIPNPWGVAFDSWGQSFFLDTSDPGMRWMTPGTVNVPYGEFAPLPPNLVEGKHQVRPTSGLEFVSSRHFPDDVQGDYMLCNSIGFLGIKQHTLEDDGTGYKSRHRQDLIASSDPNFRPVDLEFAPDGSLYVVDWQNKLIGHMQHSARDPQRDHVHGRIYRITYPARPLVKPASIAGAPLPVLLENLKLPEDRTRYRTRRELRGRQAAEVLPALGKWIATLDKADARYEHHLLEALWVTWGSNRVDQALLRQLLAAKDPRVRGAAVHVLRYSGHQIAEQPALLTAAAQDENGRVRLEAIAAASWLGAEKGLPIVQTAAVKPVDNWIKPVLDTALATLAGRTMEAAPKREYQTDLTGKAKELYLKGAEVYSREGHCITCHQENGLGLPAASFPPIAKTNWVQGSEERLIKLTLHGLSGPIEINGTTYPGLVPMTPFKGLKDEEIAAVLTYVRNSFGNKASVITPEKVAAVRAATKDQATFHSPTELLKQHPDK
jgi:mono/diheme cytochrome c family protein/glucose/arabinose dehydrogenase